MIELDDRQPCWYANLDDANNKNKAKWVVGVKGQEDVEECKFRVLRIADPQNDMSWRWATSFECAQKLMDIFKNGGKSALLQWIKNKE